MIVVNSALNFYVSLSYQWTLPFSSLQKHPCLLCGHPEMNGPKLRTNLTLSMVHAKVHTYLTVHSPSPDMVLYMSIIIFGKRSRLKVADSKWKLQSPLYNYYSNFLFYLQPKAIKHIEEQMSDDRCDMSISGIIILTI